MLSILFIPLVLATLFRDPILAIFGFKQYILYAIVGVTFIQVYSEDIRGLKTFIGILILLIIPTTILAIIQLRLGPAHWLNHSVSGDTLEGFTAAGFLRVSSTFSFGAQYMGFLMFVGSLLPTALLSIDRTDKSSVRNTVYFLIVVAMFIIGIFITGGRSAVLGTLGVALGGSILLGLRSPSAAFSYVIPIGLVLTLSFVILQNSFPDYFAAYKARSSGYDGRSHEEEIADRLSDQFFGWWKQTSNSDIGDLVFGQGLGVMSNGSDKISSYARMIRADGTWTETDFATTFWEGGFYLFIIWYVFRFMIVLWCVRTWLHIRESRAKIVGAYITSYVIIAGITATLGIQPPLAIWWWLAVGIMISIEANTRQMEAHEYSYEEAIDS